MKFCVSWVLSFWVKFMRILGRRKPNISMMAKKSKTTASFFKGGYIRKNAIMSDGEEVTF